MADVHSKETRSYNMSKIRSKNTKPEILVRRFLFANGFRYRINDKRFAGKPDIVLPKYKTMVFVQGCFWHGHKDCAISRLPQSNQEYWLPKLNRNIEKDKENIARHKSDGWKVIIVWECELRPNKIDNTLSVLLTSIRELPFKTNSIK